MAKVRWIYYLTKPLMRKKNIWLISDSVQKMSKDRIEFYKFLKAETNVDPYFVVSKDCANINELKKIGNVVIARTKKHKFLYLHAKVVLASRYNMSFFLPLYDRSNEIRDMIANKKFIYMHDGKESLAYNIKPWYNVYKFVLTDKQYYKKLLKDNNGYSKDNLLLIGDKINNKIFKLIYEEITKE